MLLILRRVCALYYSNSTKNYKSLKFELKSLFLSLFVSHSSLPLFVVVVLFQYSDNKHSGCNILIFVVRLFVCLFFYFLISLTTTTTTTSILL